MKTNLPNSTKKSVNSNEALETDFLSHYQTEIHHQDEDSILVTKIDFLDIVGTGKTQKEAYGDAFQKLKVSVYKKHNNFIIHMEPIDVIKIKDTSNLKLQKFFGMMPHRRLNWEVALRIVYQVRYIDEI